MVIIQGHDFHQVLKSSYFHLETMEVETIHEKRMNFLSSKLVGIMEEFSLGGGGGSHSNGTPPNM